jgi:hypothetical protein
MQNDGFDLLVCFCEREREGEGVDFDLPTVCSLEKANVIVLCEQTSHDNSS